MQVVILGAGMHGLVLGTVLARDGHDVTILERDPGPAPDPAASWATWERRGVPQFRQPHYLLARWRLEAEELVPELVAELAAAGAARVDPFRRLLGAPGVAPDPADARLVNLTARRPVVEAAAARVAARTPRLVVRRGVAVTGLRATTPRTAPVPHVSGVLTAGGEVVEADLVVDACGRRSPLPDWLAAIGAAAPAEERSGGRLVYASRHFRSDAMPEIRGGLLQHHDSLTVVTLPADNSTWSVALISHVEDTPMRALRDPARWHAALALYPLAAHWGEGEPLTGVDVMAVGEDRWRRLVVDGMPVVTGVVAVGDSWACTDPAFGRGLSIGLVQIRAVRDVLRQAEDDEPEKLVRRVDEATAATAEPLYRATAALDRHRQAELLADARGEPYEPDDPAWVVSKALVAGVATGDPVVARAYGAIANLLALPGEVLAAPGVLDRVLGAGAGAPRYPLPGATREELLAALA